MTSLFAEVTPEPSSEVPVRRITLKVNGQSRSVDVEPRLLLAHLIRQGFKLTGTHTGCDTTNCGACTVLFDGQPVKSCTMLAVQTNGHEVTTVEGLASASELHPIQEGFKDEHGLQCGFCTPGMMLSAKGSEGLNQNVFQLRPNRSARSETRRSKGAMTGSSASAKRAWPARMISWSSGRCIRLSWTRRACEEPA